MKNILIISLIFLMSNCNHNCDDCSSMTHVSYRIVNNFSETATIQFFEKEEHYDELMIKARDSSVAWNVSFEPRTNDWEILYNGNGLHNTFDGNADSMIILIGKDTLLKGNRIEDKNKFNTLSPFYFGSLLSTKDDDNNLFYLLDQNEI